MSNEKIVEFAKSVYVGNRGTRALPSTEWLMKVFRIFDKHGLIRDDLCFDPEHFMETVVKEHWDDEE